MTFRKTINRKVEARALTDPKPAFVSIVKAGANQVPFRSVKSDDAPEESNMSERIKVMRSQGYEVARVEFALGETFDTVESVRSWLDDGGYDYGEVTQKDTGFEVENMESTFEDGTIVEIDTGDVGITVWVGKLDAASAAKAEDEGDEPRGKVTDVQVIGSKGDDEAEHEARTGKDDDESEEGGGTGPHAAEKAAEDAAKIEDENEDVVKTVIGFAAAHKDGTPAAAKNASWDAGAEKKAADVDDLFIMSAWREDKSRDDLKKGDFKFPHHKAAGQHAVVFRALSAGVAVLNGGRGGASIPSNERKGVYNHLAKHYRDDFDETPPELASREAYEENLAISKGVVDTLAHKAAYMDEESARRFDDFMAHFSDALTLGGVLTDADDGIPLGFEEAVHSMVVAMRNNLLQGNEEGARRAANDFGDLVVALVNATESVQDEDAQRDENVKRMSDLFTAHLAEWSEKENEGEAPNVEADLAETGDDDEKDPILTAIAVLTATVEDNQTKTNAAIEEVKQEVKETLERVDKAEADLDGRVEKLEGERQARQSADATDDDGSPEETKESPIKGLALRSALGITNVSKTGGY